MSQSRNRSSTVQTVSLLVFRAAMPRLAYLFIFLILCPCALCLNILAIVSMPLGSHYMAFQPLFRQLALRGHNVTVMNNFPDKDPPPNLKFVNLKSLKPYPPLSMEEHENRDSRYSHFLNMMRHITFGSYNLRRDCENIFNSVEAQAHLKEGNKYDVIFVEQFMSDCGLAYAMSLYSAPIIGITSHVMLPFAYPRLGLPFNPAADAFYFSNGGPRPSLLHKLETFVVNSLFTSVGRWYVHRAIYESFDRHVPGHSLDIEKDAAARMKMMFSYQHYSLTGARPLAPQLLEIAGIHIGVPKPVSKEIEDFLSDATQGAIYVSFGSNLKASTMSKKKQEQFREAFRRLPYKVIWKYENEGNATVVDGKLLTASWFSQLDILCHPKVLAFVSHGGMLSLSETTHCGKPILTVPFFGDQFSNAAAVRAVGLGNTLHFDTLDADQLEEAIKQLTTQEMQQNAQRISKLWHDRPMPVMDSAIYWTEYVARHKSAPPSLPTKYNTWFENNLIDVYSVLVLILIIVGYFIVAVFKLVYFILRFILGLFSKRKVKSE